MSLAGYPPGRTYHGSSGETFRALFNEHVRVDKALETKGWKLTVAGPLRSDGTFIERTDLLPECANFGQLFQLQELVAEKLDELFDWWVDQLVDLEHATAAGELVNW